MTANIRKIAGLAAALSLALVLGGCGTGSSGGSGPTAAPSGTVSVSLTDAPGLEFDHAWITVSEIWFHTSSDADAVTGGWLKFPLAAPVTVDLAALANGTVSAPFWDKITLPAGNYQQIRIFLASTEDARTASAVAVGLSFNNEVDLGANRYPLRVPTPDQGIRLAGAFQVTTAADLRLAIDFDAGHDVVKTVRAGNVEYILKPRLAYFDLDHAGAIAGTLAAPGGVAFANYTGRNFVIKAEQAMAGTDYRVVRRATSIDPATGRFVLYPLPVFGNATTARYDIVMRGRNVETCIVNQVPVHRGTLPATATSVGPAITLTTGNEFTSTVAISPTGAWMHYYQSIPTDPVKYEVRFRHANPLTGSFFEPLQLSAGPLHVGNWNNGNGVTFASVTPSGGNGAFQAVADAMLYDRSTYRSVTPGMGTLTFGPLSPTAPAVANSISGTITMGSTMMNMMNNGLMFATFGGMIVNSVDVSSSMARGGAYTMPNLPGGTASGPLPFAFYGLYALGWGPGTLGAGSMHGIDLRTGSATGVTMQMLRIL